MNIHMSSLTCLFPLFLNDVCDDRCNSLVLRSGLSRMSKLSHGYVRNAAISTLLSRIKSIGTRPINESLTKDANSDSIII